MNDEPVVLRAPAKLTLSLHVTGVRPDGMHLIDAEMVSLDLHDELEVGPGDEVRIEGPAAGAMAGPAGTDDLVRRALRAVGRRARVVVRKRIPAGAGLGGGSSDAAAILRWAGRTDPVEAARLGADVAFCLIGGRARVRGIGEVVDALPFVERTVTLMTPPLHCSTPVVYAAWDELGGPRSSEPDANDLTGAALAAYPELVRWRDELAAATDSVPRLAGSGSTWFVDGAWPGAGRVVARTIPPR